VRQPAGEAGPARQRKNDGNANGPGADVCVSAVLALPRPATRACRMGRPARWTANFVAPGSLLCASLLLRSSC